MNYVCLNLRGMLKNHLGIFLLIMLSEIAAAICILFSYGLIMKMQDENSGLDDDMYYYRYSISGCDGLPDKVQRFLSEMGQDLESIDIKMFVTDKYGGLRECYAYINHSTGKNMEEWTCDINESCRGLAEEDGTVLISGCSFRIIDIRPNARSMSTDVLKTPNAIPVDFLFSVNCIPELASGDFFQFMVKTRPTLEYVEHISTMLKTIFNGEFISHPQPLDLMKQQQNNTFYAYALVIVMIAVMNLAMYFRYIVGLRKNQIRIFTVCGATAENLNNIFLIENLIELVTGYLFSFLIFRFGLFRILLEYYPAFEDYYSVKVYLVTFAVFVVGSLLILMLLISPHIRSTAAAGERSADR